MLGTIPEPLAFRALFESMPSASVAVLNNGPAFTIISVNDAYLRSVGSTRAQLVGKALLETAPFCNANSSRLQSARMSIEAASSSQLTSTPTAAIDQRVFTVTPIHHLDNQDPAHSRPGMLLLTLHAAEARSTSAAVERQSAAKVECIDRLVPLIGVVAVEDDRATSLPSREVFEKAVPGFVVFDLAGRVIDCNPAFARIVGRTREELHLMDSAALIHPEDLERSAKEMRRLFSGASSSFVIEKRYVRPDSTLVWVRNSVSLVRAAAGRPQQIVTISEDQTLFRMAERALIKNEKLAAVGRLSASIVHELNNPLEAVTNLLYLISHCSEVDEIRRYTHMAEQELGRVTQIATQTLRFYRHEVAPAPFQVTDVLESVLALFEGRLRKRQVSVVKRYRQANDPVRAYSGEIRQVFVNLIGNALDAMEDTGQLRIDVRPSRSWQQPEIGGVRITICDSGSGIPADMLKRIFEPFVSTKEANGTGLGLWISKEIVRRHGGTLFVRSAVSGPRRGTAMSVFLPHDVIAIAA